MRAERVTVTLGDRRVLSDVSFRARPGQVAAIVGPNGSGKTTLLKAMTGEVSHSGRVSVNGRDVRSFRPWELAAIRGVLPQSSVLAFPFTVIEVVRMGLHAGSAGGDDAVAMAALRRVGLARHAGRFVQELSGGEQQRAQLARVLAQVWHPTDGEAPRWLLLDEPVAALDIAHQLEVMEIARDFARAGGGVVAVMHDLNLTALFADRVTVLSNGHVAATGRPEEVMNDAVLSEAYWCALRVNVAPAPGTPYVLPQAASRAASVAR